VRIFVAGASGAIGQPLIAELVRRGHEVAGAEVVEVVYEAGRIGLGEILKVFFAIALDQIERAGVFDAPLATELEEAQ
jgi:nucleoside-diphosphate-sugar epimerase